MRKNNILLLIEKIINLNKLQKNFIRQSFKDISKNDLKYFYNYIKYCISSGISLDYLAESYDLIVKDTLREQIYFMRNKKYRYTTYKEVTSSVYWNSDYMKKYMYGLIISNFLWPNHKYIHNWFLKELPKDKKGSYLEIGPGHGYFFITSLLKSKYTNFHAIDISPTSIKLTRNFLEYYHRSINLSKYKLINGDFLKYNTESVYDAIVMGEVLEHVENPKLFIEKICNISNEKSFIFITTCINSPAIDHIYLFDTISSVRNLFEGSGLKITNEIILPYINHSIEESIEKMLPINIGLILTK